MLSSSFLPGLATGVSRLFLCCVVGQVGIDFNSGWVTDLSDSPVPGPRLFTYVGRHIEKGSHLRCVCGGGANSSPHFPIKLGWQLPGRAEGR